MKDCFLLAALKMIEVGTDCVSAVFVTVVVNKCHEEEAIAVLTCSGNVKDAEPAVNVAGGSASPPRAVLDAEEPGWVDDGTV